MARPLTHGYARSLRDSIPIQLVTIRQHLRLDAARSKRILDLQIADRVSGVHTPQRRRTDLRQTNITHIIGLDRAAYGTHRLLDPNGWVEARRAIDVDVVHTKPLQRVGQEILYRRRARVVAPPDLHGITQRPNFHTRKHLVTFAAGERFACEELIVPTPQKSPVSSSVMSASSAARMVAILSTRSAGPYTPDIAIQPGPIADTLVS